MPKPKDLANKDGSVFEEPPGSGKWRAQLYIDGKIVRRRATSERNAHAKLRELIKLRDAGIEVGTGKMKLSAWFDEWYTNPGPREAQGRHHRRPPRDVRALRRPLPRRPPA
jgi:hypothetical protein